MLVLAAGNKGFAVTPFALQGTRGLQCNDEDLGIPQCAESGSSLTAGGVSGACCLFVLSLSRNTSPPTVSPSPGCRPGRPCVWTAAPGLLPFSFPLGDDGGLHGRSPTLDGMRSYLYHRRGVPPWALACCLPSRGGPCSRGAPSY